VLVSVFCLEGGDGGRVISRNLKLGGIDKCLEGVVKMGEAHIYIQKQKKKNESGGGGKASVDQNQEVCSNFPRTSWLHL